MGKMPSTPLKDFLKAAQQVMGFSRLSRRDQIFVLKRSLCLLCDAVHLPKDPLLFHPPGPPVWNQGTGRLEFAMTEMTLLPCEPAHCPVFSPCQSPCCFLKHCATRG